MITLCFKDEEVDIDAVEDMYADITADLMQLPSSPFKSSVEDILMGSYFGVTVSDVMAYTEDNDHSMIVMRSVIKASRAIDCAEIKLRRYRTLYKSFIDAYALILIYDIETLMKLVRYKIRYSNILNPKTMYPTKFRTVSDAKKYLNRKYGKNCSKLLNLKANQSDSHSEQN